MATRTTSTAANVANVYNILQNVQRTSLQSHHILCFPPLDSFSARHTILFFFPSFRRVIYSSHIFQKLSNTVRQPLLYKTILFLSLLSRFWYRFWTKFISHWEEFTWPRMYKIQVHRNSLHTNYLSWVMFSHISTNMIDHFIVFQVKRLNLFVSKLYFLNLWTEFLLVRNESVLGCSN